MKKSSLIPPLDINKIKVDIDNYNFVLYSIVAFEKIFKEAISAETIQGKELKTSQNNEISKNETITPDLVVEVPQKNKLVDYKVINEIKASFPEDKDRWLEDARQLKKYDDKLSGWKYNTTFSHDIMLTTDISFSNEFKEYMDELEKSAKIKIKRSFSILECVRRERAVQQLFIRKFSGEISNDRLDKIFSSGQAITLYNILNDINKMKFYDASPPTVYTMMILWDFVFPRFINSRIKFRDLNANRIVELEITLEQMYRVLKKFTPDSNPNCIKKSWIEKALLWFNEIGSVISPETGEKFVIKYRKVPKEKKILDWILEKVSGKTKSSDKNTENQTLDEHIPNLE